MDSELLQLMRVLWKRKWLILAVTSVFVAGVALWTMPRAEPETPRTDVRFFASGTQDMDWLTTEYLRTAMLETGWLDEQMATDGTEVPAADEVHLAADPVSSRATKLFVSAGTAQTTSEVARLVVKRLESESKNRAEIEIASLERRLEILAERQKDLESEAGSASGEVAYLAQKELAEIELHREEIDADLTSARADLIRFVELPRSEAGAPSGGSSWKLLAAVLFGLIVGSALALAVDFYATARAGEAE